jgi:hypothetical protein
MALKYLNIFPILGPQKFPRILIFGLKTNHLATLIDSEGNKGMSTAARFCIDMSSSYFSGFMLFNRE